MHFEIAHEFDIPLDALELAVVSPNLIRRLDATVRDRAVGIEKISEKRHDLRDGVLDRQWHYQANVHLPQFARGYVTRDMCAWDENSVYEMKAHRGSWTIVPRIKPEWQKYFSASGTYAVEALGGGRSRRQVEGHIELRVRVVRQMAERLIVGEVKKAFEAEASTLREMATLI
ncbi:MAG: DUF2505 family protein [Polyangiaceae bacterium]